METRRRARRYHPRARSVGDGDAGCCVAESTDNSTDESTKIGESWSCIRYSRRGGAASADVPGTNSQMHIQYEANHKPTQSHIRTRQTLFHAGRNTITSSATLGDILKILLVNEANSIQPTSYRLISLPCGIGTCAALDCSTHFAQAQNYP